MDSSEVTSKKQSITWENEKRKHPSSPSYFRSLLLANLPIMLYTMFCAAMWAAIIIFVPVYLVRHLIIFVEDKHGSPSGWISFLFFFFTFPTSFLLPSDFLLPTSDSYFLLPASEFLLPPYFLFRLPLNYLHNISNTISHLLIPNIH